MFNKLFAMFGLEIVKKETPAPKKTEREIAQGKRASQTKVIKSDEQVERELNKTIEEIQGQILENGYTAIPKILSECNIHSIEHFVRLQLVNLGQYDPENDNLEGLNKEQLIKFAMRNNKEQFKLRSIERGNVRPASDAQLDLIERLAGEHDYKVDFSKIKTTFDASDMIEEITEKFKLKSNNSSEASEKQIETIHKLCQRLNLEVACEMYEDKATASATISNLIAMAPPSEPHTASDAQIDYAMRLWVQCGHKKTAKKEASFKAMTSSELSKVINELKKEYKEKNPNANAPSDGQLQYIRQLFEICLLPVPSAEEMPKTSEQASNLIAKMNKKYLYIITRATNPSMTEKDINKLPASTVKELIAQAKAERLTRHYTQNPTTGGQERTEGHIAF